jgi:glycogen operon protein
VTSDNDTVVAFGHRCFGSPDLYAHKDRGPEQSINFVTSHDGFTLNDLVSYNAKHNEANGEGGLDGCDSNFSWNCGVEGPTADPEIERLRQRQVKNVLAITLLSLGVPMLLMGDEVRRTQRGNNNAYCQDNEVSWFDWTLLERHRDLHRFVKTLVRQRLMLGKDLGIEGVSLNELLRSAEIEPHGVRLHEPDLSPWSHSLAVTVRPRLQAVSLHVMFNAYWQPLPFDLPRPEPDVHGCWRRWIDTNRDAPDDVWDGTLAPAVESPIYTVEARSLVVLFALGGDAMLPPRFQSRGASR